MLQDIPTPTLREASPCVLETERLTLAQADARGRKSDCAARQRSPHRRKYPPPAASLSAGPRRRIRSRHGRGRARETVFLIENNFAPIGMVGIDWREPEAPELGYWLGVEHWGQGFGTEAARAVIDFVLRGVRDRASVLRCARRQPLVAQHSGEMRLPVERRRTAPLRGAGLLDPGRLLPAVARRLVVAEELEQFDAAVGMKSSSFLRMQGRRGRFSDSFSNSPPSSFRDATSWRGPGIHTP